MGGMTLRDKRFGAGMSDLPMTRRRFLVATSLAVVGSACGPIYGFADDSAVTSQRVKDFFENNLIFDAVVQRAPKGGAVLVEPGEIKRLTGINAGFMSLPPARIAEIAKSIDNRGDSFLLIRRAADIDEAYRTGRYGVGLYVQKGFNLTNGLDQLRSWHEQGLRSFQPTYSELNELGGGTLDDKAPLTPLGRDALRLCEELGIVFDVSHCGKRTTLDAARFARKPITANHCNPEARCKSRRNKSDAELRAIAATGGVIGVMAINCFLVPQGKATADDFAGHVEYLARRIGMNHVGVSSDSMLDGLNKADRYECGPTLRCYERWGMVAENLLRRGFTEDHLAKIFGLNFKRVYNEILI